MSRLYELKIFDRHTLSYSSEFTGAIELGRQSKSDERLYTPRPESNGVTRIVIARLEEQTVSRSHVYLEPLPDGKFRLTNKSNSQPIHIMGGEEVKPRAAPCVLTPPVLLNLGAKTIRVQEVGSQEDNLQSLPASARAPGTAEAGSRFATLSLKAASNVELEEVLYCLQATMDLLQCAAGSSDFFQKATQTAVELVGLDWASVLLLAKDETWKEAASYVAPGTTVIGSRSPSQRILNRVRNDRRTFWQTQPPANNEGGSLAGIQAFVAAPILHRQGYVMGVLYGSRQMGRTATSTPITKLEAMMVELLASSVAAGLSRQEQEQAALAAHVRLEQFFTPELARQIASRPDLLQGRDAEVTLLFCDIRNFSNYSERLGPARTVEWVSDVMESLSEAVMQNDGVLVDYIGDELLAMWGAPEPMANHAQLATRAALAMVERLPELNARWQPVLGAPMDFGIGVNSGTARVGNIGSKRKIKYGPLGNTVNLASRVQGANKYLKTRLLITGATRKQLDDSFETRRLCTVRVVHINEPVELYEVVQTATPQWRELKEQYETALAEFERWEFGQAVMVLGSLVRNYSTDGPSLVLLSRTVPYLVQGGHTQGNEAPKEPPVWELSGK